jgi:hypothetical protein
MFQESNNNLSICVAGWYFPEDLYSLLAAVKANVYVVAHKDNSLLMQFENRAAVIENVGLEFHMYDYFLKNMWNTIDDIVFLQDDASIGDPTIFAEISRKCKESNFEAAYVWESEKQKRINGHMHGRCIYTSAKITNKILQAGGLWYNKNDTGYANDSEFKKWFSNRNLGIHAFNRTLNKTNEVIGHVFISRKDFKLFKRGC